MTIRTNGAMAVHSDVPAASESMETRLLLTCQVDGHFVQVDNPDDISDLLTQTDSFIWLDMQCPQERDIALLRDEFQFHPLAIEDAVRAHERPKIDAYDQYYFIVFYAVEYHPQTQQLQTEALHLFIGQNYVVSVHNGPISEIDQTIHRWRAVNSPMGRTPAALLHALLDTIVDNYFPLIDRLADRIDDLEDTLFAHFEQTSLQKIFTLKKELLQLRRTLAPERDVLNVLLRQELPIFTERDVPYLQDVYDHVVRITDSIDSYRELLSSALDSYLSLQSNQLNLILKALTITSIILMSATLVAGIYGMNFDFMPELHWRYGYAWALGWMVFISGGLIVYFRRRGWL